MGGCEKRNTIASRHARHTEHTNLRQVIFSACGRLTFDSRVVKSDHREQGVWNLVVAPDVWGDKGRECANL